MNKKNTKEKDVIIICKGWRILNVFSLFYYYYYYCYYRFVRTVLNWSQTIAVVYCSAWQYWWLMERRQVGAMTSAPRAIAPPSAGLYISTVFCVILWYEEYLDPGLLCGHRDTLYDTTFLCRTPPTTLPKPLMFLAWAECSYLYM